MRHTPSLVLVFTIAMVLALVGGGVSGQPVTADDSSRPIEGQALNTTQLSESASVVTESTPTDRTYVIHAANASAIDQAVLSTYGEVGTQVRNRVELTMPPINHSKVADLTWVSEIRRAQFAQTSQVAGSGSVSDLGVSDIHSKNITGDGVRVGIIDTNFRPEDPLIRDNIADVQRFNDYTDPTHGVQAAQTLVQTAPDAELYLAAVSTGTDVVAAIDHLQQQNVDVIVMSLGFPAFDDDGDHILAEQAAQARGNGTLVVFSAGNQRQRHWQGEFTDPDNDNFLDWAEGDERQCIPDCNRDFGGRITIFLDYPRDGDGSNYQAELVNPVSRTLLGVSQRVSVSEDRVVEVIQVSLADQAVDLQVKHTEGPADDTVEINVAESDIQRPVERSSILPPADASAAVSVAAYDRSNQQTAFYSSVGPTDDFRQAPTVAGYTNIDTSAGVFTGTSAAAPYVAGVSALIEAGTPSDQSPADIETRLSQTADDIEQPGIDSRSGAGMVNAEAAVPTQTTSGNDSGGGEDNRAGPDGTGEFDTENGTGTFFPGATVFQGESDIFPSDDFASTPTKNVDGATNISLDVPTISQNQETGRYEDSQGNRVTVQTPRVTTLEVLNSRLEDISGDSVPKGTDSGGSGNLTVIGTWNYDEAENVELTIVDDSGRDVTGTTLEADASAVTTGADRGANLASGRGGDLKAKEVAYPVDLSDTGTGTYTIVLAGTDDLDFSEATQSTSLTVTKSNASIEFDETTAVRGQDLGFEITGSDSGDQHIVLIGADDFREGVSDSNAQRIFREVDNDSQVGIVADGSAYDRGSRVPSGANIDYAYALLTINDNTGVATGLVETQYLEESDVNVVLYNQDYTSAFPFDPEDSVSVANEDDAQTLTITSPQNSELGVSATVDHPGQPGGTAKVTYTLTNLSGQNSAILNITDIPESVNINESASDFGGTFSNGTILYFSPGSSEQATVAFDIAPTVEAGATFTIVAQVEDENGTVGERVQTTLGEQGIPQQYDRNGNNRIDLDEVRIGINDFAAGELTIQEVRILINYWANETSI